MAFFGISWLPTHSTSTPASEANPRELCNLTRQIRADSCEAMRSKHKRLEAAYSHAYATYEQLAAAFKPNEAAVENALSALTEGQVLVVTGKSVDEYVRNAGRLRVEGDPRGHAVIAEMMSAGGATGGSVAEVCSSAGEFIEVRYVPLLREKKKVEEAERQLWVAYGRMAGARGVYELFEFETVQADKALEEDKKAMSLEVRKEKRRAAGNDARLEEIRMKNKEKLRQRKMERKSKIDKKAATTDAWSFKALLDTLPGSSPFTAPSGERKAARGTTPDLRLPPNSGQKARGSPKTMTKEEASSFLKIA
eukprot:GHVQ01024900.1.p1 GENE.GHVQ01024900.1~~GHVQ01024900.1.p1  ORF type:complete len:308 (+),score=80.43 GHVQ01024900.1:419-1342(+)